MNQPTNSRFAVVSRRVVVSGRVNEAAVVIGDGKIEAVVPVDGIPAGVQRRDYGDLVVMAGLIDPHVHINEPGRAGWEGFRTATRAAAAGGVTTVIDMPLNSVPVTTTVDALDRKIQAAHGQLFVDCGFYGGLVPGNVSHIQSLIDQGVFGIKAFLIDSGIDEFPAVDESTLERAMPVIAQSDAPLLVHAEKRSARTETKEGASWTRYATYLASRPVSWELSAIAILAELGHRYGGRIHIVHLAAADGVDIIARARTQGVMLSVETCPHYLFFDAESIADRATLFKCAPPIRDRANNRRLFAYLKEGVIDFIATDHSPTVPSAKAIESGDFSRAWGGIASLELRLPVTWTVARSFGCTLLDVSRWLARNPAEFLGLGGLKGEIAPGQDADLVVWDPEQSFRVDRNGLHDRHRLTPYEGLDLHGVVRATYVRGIPVFEDEHFEGPCGRILRRKR